jgi:hypothetical protein
MIVQIISSTLPGHFVFLSLTRSPAAEHVPVPLKIHGNRRKKLKRGELMAFAPGNARIAETIMAGIAKTR